MAKRRKSIKKEATKFHVAVFRTLKRGVRKVPGVFWGSFALIGALIIGIILGIFISQKPAVDQTPYQKEKNKNEKYLKLVTSYEDLNKLYSDQAENFDIAFSREMIEGQPDQVNAAILSIDHYRDRILLEKGRIDQLRRDIGIPLVDFSHR